MAVCPPIISREFMIEEGLYDNEPSYVRATLYERIFGKIPFAGFEAHDSLVERTKLQKWIDENGFELFHVKLAHYHDDGEERSVKYYINRKTKVMITLRRSYVDPAKEPEVMSSDDSPLERRNNKNPNKLVYFSFFGPNEEITLEFKKIFESMRVVEDSKNKLYMLKSTEYNGLELDSFPTSCDDMSLELNYGKEFSKTHGHIIDCLINKKSGLYVFHGPPGTGKCLAKGTPVLMYDGSIKNVENIQNGELVMGPDSTPRKVSGVTNGQEEMFRITPKKGAPYTVNRSHILSLKYSGRHDSTPHGSVVNISVKDYLSLSDYKKRRLKTWRTAISFERQEVPLDPYFLGIWLGDGHSHHPTLTTADEEVFEFVKAFAESHTDEDIYFHEISQPSKAKLCCLYGRRGRYPGGKYPENYIKRILSDLGVLNNKHIPSLYKINDAGIQLQVLAGLIDSDGDFHDGKALSITQKSDKLAEDICFLCRSLGFAAYKKPVTKYCSYKGRKRIGVYYTVLISGDLNKIPTKIKHKRGLERKQIKDVLVSGIKVEPLGVGDYYGFEVDKDGLFCLGDFTVTHNTSYIKYLTTIVENRKFIFVPNTMVSELFSPKLVDKLYSFKNSVLVLEDAEVCVFKRDGNNNALVSGILNITDGLLKDLLNIAIIVTFNSADVTELDTALLRKGRLKIMHRFDLLSVEDAQRLAIHLKSKKSVSKPMSLADIYNLDEETGVEEVTPKKVGF